MSDQGGMWNDMLLWITGARVLKAALEAPRVIEAGRRALSLGQTGAAAGRTAVERGAVRATQFVVDPKAGFAKGVGIGFNKGFFTGDAAVEMPSINPQFDRVVEWGEAMGNIFAPISRGVMGGFPP